MDYHLHSLEASYTCTCDTLVIAGTSVTIRAAAGIGTVEAA